MPDDFGSWGNMASPECTKHKPDAGRKRLSRAVEVKERRKVCARCGKSRAVWFGLGMFGMVGWAVAIPTVLGTTLGVWVDRTFPSRYSWTIMGLFAGIVLGCFNAWYWVKRESREIGE